MFTYVSSIVNVTSVTSTGQMVKCMYFWHIPVEKNSRATFLSIYLVLRHLIANICKSRTPYRFHIGSFEEKLRREDDDLMTSACSFNEGKHNHNG